MTCIDNMRVLKIRL